MEGDAASVPQDIVLAVWGQAELFLWSMLRPWNAYQLGILLALFFAAYLLERLLGPACREWMRQREGWPK